MQTTTSSVQEDYHSSAFKSTYILTTMEGLALVKGHPVLQMSSSNIK